MMKKMTNERLCALAQQGDIRAQEQLIHNNLGYIRKLQMNCTSVLALETVNWALTMMI